MAGGMGRRPERGVPLGERVTSYASGSVASVAPVVAGEERTDRDQAAGESPVSPVNARPRRTRLVLVDVEGGDPAEGFVVDWAQDRQADGGWVALVLTAVEDQVGAVCAVQRWLPASRLTPVLRR